MTEKEKKLELEKELGALKFELKQKLYILEKARKIARLSAESAEKKKEKISVEIVELRRMKDENLREINRQGLTEEYTYEKGKQKAYEHIINLLY